MSIRIRFWVALVAAPALGAVVALAVGGSGPPRGATAATGSEPPSTAGGASGTPASTDILELALDRIDQVYWRPEEVDRARLLASGVQRLEHLGDDILVTEVPGGLRLEAGGQSLTVPTGGLTSSDTLLARLREAIHFVEAYHRQGGDDPQGRDASVELLRGLVQPLDRHCRVIDARQKVDFDVRYQGTLSGVGARIGREHGRILVREAYDDGPAWKAGVRDLDVITHIDGVSTTNLGVDDAVERIRGDEGTTVRLDLERAGAPAPLSVSVVRARVLAPSVHSRLLEGGAGSIRIDHFSRQTFDEFTRHFHKLQAAAPGGALAGLLIDLRGNKGGSLLHAARVSDLFLDGGPMVTTQGRDGGAVEGLVAALVARPGDDVPRLPVVTLVDQDTASGAEIVAGALKFRDRAAVLGVQTFGKGTVQKVYPLRDDVELKITVARYLLADGKWGDTVGITPDVALGRVEDPDGRLAFPDHLPVRPHAEPGRPRAPGGPWSPYTGGANAAPGRRVLVAGDEGDPGLELARRMVLAAPGDATRQGLLRAAGPLLDEAAREGAAAVARRVREHRIPWSDGPADWCDRSPERSRAAIGIVAGPPPDGLDLDLTIDGGALQAGAEGTLRLRATSRRDQILPHLRVRVASALRAVDGLDLVVGDLEPGTTRDVIAAVTPPARLLDQADTARLYAVSDGTVLGSAIPARLVQVGAPQPRFAVRWTSSVSAGAGGQRVEVRVQVRNDGEGPSGPLALRIDNPGLAGVELTAGSARIEPLAPGATGEASLVLTGPAGMPDPLSLRVHVADEERGVSARRKVEVTSNSPTAPTAWSASPRISLPERGSRPLVGADSVTLDLRVEDPDGVDRVLVSVDGDRVFNAIIRQQKIAYLKVRVPAPPGPHRVRVEAVDALGTRGDRSLYVLGEGVPAGGGEPDGELPAAD